MFVSLFFFLFLFLFLFLYLFLFFFPIGSLQLVRYNLGRRMGWVRIYHQRDPNICSHHDFGREILG